MSEHFFIYDGTYYSNGTPVISMGNRSLMYGDGIFETMLVHKGEIINKPLHFERFFYGLELLKISVLEDYSTSSFTQKIQDLLLRNNSMKWARVRLMAFRKSVNLKPEKCQFNYIIEAWPLENFPQYNPKGLSIGLFRDATKSCDRFSNLKSNNYLPSVMAIIFAKEKNYDECLLLNSNGRVCESAIGNIFLVKNGLIYTPPLSEGCVAGVVRRWIIENLPSAGFQLIQKELTVGEVLDADELFLTNSIRPVRRVETLESKKFGSKVTEIIAGYVFKQMIKSTE